MPAPRPWGLGCPRPAGRILGLPGPRRPRLRSLSPTGGLAAGPIGGLPARHRAILDVAAPAVEIGPRQQAAMGTTACPVATVVVIVAPASITARRAAEPLAVDEIAAPQNRVAAARSGAGEGRGHAGPYAKRYGCATPTAPEACQMRLPRSARIKLRLCGVGPWRHYHLPAANWRPTCRHLDASVRQPRSSPINAAAYCGPRRPARYLSGSSASCWRRSDTRCLGSCVPLWHPGANVWPEAASLARRPRLPTDGRQRGACSPLEYNLGDETELLSLGLAPAPCCSPAMIRQ